MNGDPPCARLAHPDSRAREVFTQALVVLRQPAELELGHGLFRARAHSGGVSGVWGREVRSRAD